MSKAGVQRVDPDALGSHITFISAGDERIGHQLAVAGTELFVKFAEEPTRLQRLPASEHPHAKKAADGTPCRVYFESAEAQGELSPALLELAKTIKQEGFLYVPGMCVGSMPRSPSVLVASSLALA